MLKIILNKIKKMYYFNIQKEKIKQKYFLLFFEFIIVLLKIDLVNLQILNNTRKLNNYDSKIKLVIANTIGSSYIKILNYKFNPEPSQVIINEVTRNDCKKSCNLNLEYNRNNAALIFENQIETCRSMFEGAYNIIEADLSEFNASGVINMSYMFKDCFNLRTIKFGNINISLVENMEGLFYGCEYLKIIDLTNLDISHVKTMKRMFYGCLRLEKINFGNINTSSLENIDFLFANCRTLKSIDLENLDISKVKRMSYTFYKCLNLKEINFGNINTSSVENMEGLFAYCTSLTSIDLSNFDTSNVETMEAMFYHCYNLKYLDLSNFITPKVTTIYEMFYYCSSLIYLNLFQFQMNSPVNKSYAFDWISENVKYCINDTETKNYLLGINTISICSDTCYNESNLKGDSINYKCIESCQIIGYDYEYNSVCYEKCPNGTLLNDNLCEDNKCDNNEAHYCGSYYYCYCGIYYGYDYCCCSYYCNYHSPEGYYLDSDDGIYKKCYKNCKFCNGKGNETINNCKECISDYTFLNETKNKTNCYKKCDYYYYYESDEYHCIDNLKCPENYSKLIEN